MTSSAQGARGDQFSMAPAKLLDAAQIHCFIHLKHQV